MTTQLPTQQGGEVDDGGPAFPFPVMHGKGAPNGISMRDYFAAHAPSRPASWFAPKHIDLPHWSEKNRLKLPHIHSAMVGHCEACDEYFKASALFDAERTRRTSAYEFARYAQWPWAYADAMIAARIAS